MNKTTDNMMNFRGWSMGVLVWLCCLLAACTDLTPEAAAHPEQGKDGYNLEVNVPMGELVLSRAADAAKVVADIDLVERMDVLFFRKSEEGKYVFQERKTVNNFIRVGTKFVAHMDCPYDGTPHDYQLIAFANADDSAGWEKLQKDVTTPDDVPAMITCTASSAMPSSSAPMASYSLISQTIQSDADFLTFSLQRAVARFDVDASAVAYNFILKTVEVRNARATGCIMRNMQNKDLPNLPKDGAVVDYLLPEGVTDQRDQTGEVDGVIQYANKITGKAFALENGDNTSSLSGNDNNTCLIIGGEYSDKLTGTTKMTYFRVDIGEKDSNNQWVYRVRRNHCYTVTVTGIFGFGADTADEAFNSAPKNATFDIASWDSEGQGGVVYNGAQLLAADLCLIQVGPQSQGMNYTVKVKTVNVDFSSIKLISPEADWVKLSELQEEADGASFTVTLQSDLPEEISERTAYFSLTSGDMELPLCVRQSNKENAMITFNVQQMQVSAAGMPSKSEAASSGQTYPAQGQKLTFNVSGLSDATSATWTLSVEDAYTSWMGVESTAGEALGKSNPLSGSRDFCLTVKPLHDNINRLGYLTLEVTSRGVVYTKKFQVTQYATPMIGNFLKKNAATALSTSSSTSSQTISFSIYSTVDWELDFGSLFESGMVTDLYDGTNSNDPEARHYTSSDIITGAPVSEQTFTIQYNGNNGQFWSSTLKLINRYTRQILDEWTVFQPIFSTDDSYYINAARKISVYSGIFIFTDVMPGSRYTIGGPDISYCFFWGQRKNNLPMHALTDTKRWNAGTEENPVKGEYDPCPYGWRMLTKKEYEMLVALNAFSGRAVDTDTQDLPLNKNFPINNSEYPMKEEWTSYNDGEHVYRFNLTNQKVNAYTYEQIEAEMDSIKDADKWQYYNIRCIRDSSY